ncbi:hypothetical protein GCM10007881_31210 [Mesorhizobium huakuii]|uniref:DUF3775 domain-containing protein n=1 Tax=Mesorhizobium TaxID=68287 RepID=UPI001F0A1A2A|nr:MULTISPECIES: DUF3775 domain-containing protein [Mesorhizobium]MCH4560730.1 DUF3775 domain-containing protein [Mesorhizobium jarvisii]GLQ79602.1 hypothetical protein GCM10007881_31210 [Mesorhizobium huakuii]
MLKALNVDHARFIGLLARSARTQRDRLLGNVQEQDLAGPAPVRGEHNPTAEFGLEPFPSDSSPTVLLREALSDLSEKSLCELYALMRVGQGHLAARKFYRGVSEAQTLGSEMVVSTLIEDPDLHDHIAKALFATKLAS